MAEQYFNGYMYHLFLIHSSVDRHVGCFRVLAIVDSAAMNVKIGTEIRAVQLQAKEC